MVKEKKIGCMIFSIGKTYRKLSQCAVRSFKKFHPDVDVHYIDESNVDNFKVNKYIPEQLRDHYGILRFAIAAEIMGTEEYDKFIVLGADTITCSRLDEFIDQDTPDIIFTSDYPYQLNLGYAYADKIFVIASPVLAAKKDPESGAFVWDPENPGLMFIDVNRANEQEDVRVIDYLHANADVTCFNSLAALKDVYKFSLKHWKDYHQNVHLIKSQEKNSDLYFYGDQGALNIIATFSLYQAFKGVELPPPLKYSVPSYKIQFVDVPYEFASVVYNATGKKSLDERREQAKIEAPVRHEKATELGSGEIGPSVSHYHTKDDKLYTIDDKQIKVWHYHTGFGSLIQQELADKSEMSPEEKNALIQKEYCRKVNIFIFEIFNQETRDFFTNHCDCGDFFQKEFTLE